MFDLKLANYLYIVVVASTVLPYLRFIFGEQGPELYQILVYQ
jgi:hypothetical protein